MPGFRIETDSLAELQVQVDIFQTGSGTSINMNANGVIAQQRRRDPRRSPQQQGGTARTL